AVGEAPQLRGIDDRPGHDRLLCVGSAGDTFSLPRARGAVNQRTPSGRDKTSRGRPPRGGRPRLLSPGRPGSCVTSLPQPPQPPEQLGSQHGSQQPIRLRKTRRKPPPFSLQQSQGQQEVGQHSTQQGVGQHSTVTGTLRQTLTGTSWQTFTG